MNMAMNPLPRADLEHVLDHTRDLWSSLRRETLFITGGTGFLGRWLLESFCHANQALDLQARAVVLTRRPEHFAARAPHLATNPALLLLRGDVRQFDPDDLSQLAGQLPGDIRFVVHAAEPQSPCPMALRDLDVLHSGTRRVLEWAVTQSALRVLLLGSGAIYGAGLPGTAPLAEDARCAPGCDLPGNVFAEGKRVMELLGAIFHKEYELDCKVARCFGVAGPGMLLRVSDPLGYLLQQALAGPAASRPAPVPSVGSYLYLADFAIWLWTILLRDSPSSVYNVGSDEAVSMPAIAAQVGRLSAQPWPSPEIVSPTPIERERASYYVPDISRARRELGLDVLD